MPKIILLCLCLFLKISLEALPAQVMIIRHAEKPPTGDSLTLKGRERAQALVPYFIETPELILNGTPVAIYAMGPDKLHPSERPIETVQPLADKLGTPIKTQYIFEDYKRLVEEIKTNSIYHGKNVLICWEHQNIPEIARAFGALQTPAKWLPEAFDRTWVIFFSATGKASFQNLPQRLMYGDSPH